MSRGVEVHNGAIVIPSNDIPAGMIGDFALGQQIGVNVPATAVVQVVMGIHIVNTVEVTPAGGYYGIRFSEHGPDTVTINSILMFYVPRAEVLYLIELITGDKAAWAAIGTVTGGARGWLKIRVGTTPDDQDRYIKLWEGPTA